MHNLELDLINKMLNFVALSKQNAVALQRPVSCAGYWLENNIAAGEFTSNIEHDPMTAPIKASFYKESGN